MDQHPALGLDESALAALLAQQDGVVSRRQLRSLGAQRHDIDRLLRRHRLAQSHPRVYVDHTGPLTPRQRAWAAVLYAAPAALSGRSALADPEPNAPVHVSIDASRRLTAPDGVRIQRRRDFAAQVLWNASPPRLRYDAAVLDLVEEASDEMAVVRLLSDAIGSRRTTVARLRSTLAGRSRMPRRRWLSRLLDDLATGACSVLEHAYLTRVERAHGLPLPDRQAVRTGVAGREYRDASYAVGVTVELDGRLGHASFDGGGRDADRDLDDHADGREAVRLRWHQVVDTPCRTALQLARILQRRGWAGMPIACGPDCAVAELATE
ncbi:hypothetical protein [Nocardioides soli]|uniref:Type IV toxin-antitoxin system AbiEi family antitoxin domain-containing protein n=1 Tax=Nocardioides soli TaxID=1036020 RepID=A0A7W4Z1V8_9ACTN|nr:hypothetical protein [Nocardioides soli]MBB3042256.1 hypothetical protein [Nocardioides soli]